MNQNAFGDRGLLPTQKGMCKFKFPNAKFRARHCRWHSMRKTWNRLRYFSLEV